MLWKRKHKPEPISDEQKLENLEWLQSLIPNAVVIDVDENGEPVDLSQIDNLRNRIECEINNIKGGQQ